jgi:hypothetical protein
MFDIPHLKAARRLVSSRAGPGTRPSGR